MLIWTSNLIMNDIIWLCPTSSLFGLLDSSTPFLIHCDFFSLWFHPTKWSSTSFIFARFDHTRYEANWKSMIERTKTPIFLDFESILKTLERTLLIHLEKRALKTQGRGSQLMILICGWQMNHHSWNPWG
jgi:hypothetical protein